MRFEEMELTSFFYTMINMEKKLKFSTDPTQDRVWNNFSELYQRIETVLNSKVVNETISYKRVPYILYCFSMVGRGQPKILEKLMSTLVNNVNKYSVTEICTVLYCMWKMPELDPTYEKLILILNLYFDNQAIELLLNTDLYMALLGVRKAIKNSTNQKHREYLEVFVGRLANQFEKKFDMIVPESKIRIIYELVYTHKALSKEKFQELYLPFFMGLNLQKMNNHDIITVGYILKMFIILDEHTYKFWDTYLGTLSGLKLESQVEKKRAKIIFSNLTDLISNNPKIDANVKTDWVNMISNHHKKFESHT